MRQFVPLVRFFVRQCDHPRPLSWELISSWLLRVANANHVSLADLLDGFGSQYPEVHLSGELIDCSLSSAAFDALGRFCRVGKENIQALDLRKRIPLLNPALVLRFSKANLMCPRRAHQRVRYAFCPLCLLTQQNIHIRWDWSLACLIRCSIHRVSLCDGCQDCGEPDPLPLSSSDLACRSCGGDLTQHQERELEPEHYIHAIEDAYRVALLGIAPHPSLLDWRQS